jgi:hypothetical protein
MKGIDHSKIKMKEVEKLLAEVKERLKTPGKGFMSHREKTAGETAPIPKKEPRIEDEEKISAKEIVPSEDELRNLYEKLYEQFVARDFASIKEFIKTKSKVYLLAFCKANKLPIDASKVSKERIAEEVMLWTSQRKAITKKLT